MKMAGSYLCSGWKGAQSLVNLADDLPEGILVQLGVFPQSAHWRVRALLDQSSHHVVPALQPPVLPV